jgi:hypothetical protein
LIKENVIASFEIIKYSSDDYIRLLDELAAGNIIGGASYDGLILYAARQIKIDKILTLNINYFIRIAPKLIRLISEP